MLFYSSTSYSSIEQKETEKLLLETTIEAFLSYIKWKENESIFISYHEKIIIIIIIINPIIIRVRESGAYTE